MSEIDYKSLLQSTSDWIWAVDINGVYTYCSENVYDYLGYRADEVVGKTPFDFMSPEEAQRVAKLFGKFIQDQAPIEGLENNYIHRFGVEITVSTTAIPSYDAEGNFIGYQGFDKDITAYKKMQTQIQDYSKEIHTIKERMDSALLGSNIGIWEWNLAEDTLYLSEQWKALLGYRDSALSNHLQTWKNRIHSDDIEKTFAAIETSIKFKTLYIENVHRLKHRNNEWLWVLMRAQIEYDKEGTAVRMLGTHTDITKDKEVEARLEELNVTLEARIREEVEKNRLKDRALLQQSIQAHKELNKALSLFGENVISSITDRKGIITHASAALCKISGYSQEELLGQPHNILRHKDMPSSVFKELWHSIRSGKEWIGEIKNSTKEGGYYWVRTSIIPELDENSKVIAYTSIRHDITAQKAKESFMANMSHELRTPLNAIIGFSSILSRKIEDAQNRDLAHQVNSSANGLLSLINDILDLSKIQDSSFSIEPYDFNAYEEMINFCKNFSAIKQTKNLHIKSDVDKNLDAIFYADWHRISQIILNLISNAIKFTPENGEILFTAVYKDDSMIFKIQDNGIGMSQSVQDKIFKPFEQADGSTTRQYGGTGLGLSITQNLVELMEGTIQLHSNEREGSTFTVTLPIQRVENSKEDLRLLQSEETTEAKKIKGHILIAEDNKTNQMLLEMLLEEFNISCDIANDGLEAVELYDPQKHALILMDENMPNMSGLDAMQKIRSIHKEKTTPIIALTANAMKGDKEKFLALGMSAYISKPIDEKYLYLVLEKFL